MIKDIPHRTVGLEKNWVFRILFKIFPEADNEIIHGPGSDAAVISPDHFDQLPAGKSFAPVDDEKL
jgi:hypothetical protein